MKDTITTLPPCRVDFYQTESNPLSREVGLRFQSGDMGTMLVFPAEVIPDLIKALEKSHKNATKKDQ